ncbi:threonine--tRNA ligase [archaeon]|nr:threonine--tRNA ligase [archaeon]
MPDKKIAEGRKDHKRIGQELDLFSISEQCGSGLPLLSPKGAIVRNQLMQLITEKNSQLGFREVWTPHMFRSELWKKSGHYDKFKQDMFFLKVDDEEFALKPMNCPGHINIYSSRQRSYRELPIRYSEFGTVYRNEQSGELNGLLRVRSITQDDGHGFYEPEQIKEEVKNIARAALDCYVLFGMHDYRVKLSTRPEKYIGTPDLWDRATSALRSALSEIKVKFEVKEGEGAFYGPKIDIDICDSLGRWWQCGTVQLDFAMPERFELEYVGADGKKHRPVMIHRAILGSLERFMGVLIEHLQGAFPSWLAPVQVAVITVSQEANEYSERIVSKLAESGLRAELYASADTMQYRIRAAQEQKIPYMLILGKKEQEAKSVSVRRRDGKQASMSLEKFVSALKREVAERKPELTVA